MSGLGVRALTRLWLLLCVSGLAACGGGGGGGGSLTITLSPNPLTASYQLNQLPAQVRVNATVSGSISATTVYVLVADTGNTFQSGSLSLYALGNNRPVVNDCFRVA